MANPKLTVVTPSYNQGRYLEQTLRSVLDQGYDNLEYIVMDGGSTDKSVSIIKKYESGLSYWQSAPDDGQGPAIIDGWKRSTGSFVTWINSDDLLLPGSLQAIADLAGQGADILTGDNQDIDESGVLTNETPQWRGPRWMYLHGLIHLGQPGTFYRRSLVERVEYFDQGLEFSMEFDLQMRLLHAGATVAIANQPMAALRHHNETKSSLYEDAFAEERRRVYSSHIRGLLGSYRVRESAIAALRYPYALRFVVPHNWSSGCRRGLRLLGRVSIRRAGRST